MKSKLNYLFHSSLKATALVAVTAQMAAAQGMPWEGTFTKILGSLEGPTARLLIIIAIVIAGLTFALGESGGFFRKAAGIVFGGAIAIGATAFVGTLFGV